MSQSGYILKLKEKTGGKIFYTHKEKDEMGQPKLRCGERDSAQLFFNTREASIFMNSSNAVNVDEFEIVPFREEVKK